MCGLALCVVGLCQVQSARAESEAPAWLTTQLGGLTASSNVASQDAFGQPSSELATNQLRQFTFGNRIFNTNWVAAPASVDGFDGLGPVFNRVSCSGCHLRDGRGQPPKPGESLESMLVRISIPGRAEHGGVVPVPHYGDQLNEKAIVGVPAEARTVVRYTERSGSYPDGTRYTLAVPSYEFADLAFGPLPANTQCSPRVAPAVFGLGLLETVPEATLLAHADPQDTDRDGISGRANYVWDVTTRKRALGRFGWKANQPNLRQQDAAAALGDIGLRTSMFPTENVAEGQTAAAAAPSGAPPTDPELRDEFLDRLTFYVQVLAVPAARNLDKPAVRAGAQLFERARCSACHIPTLKTGDQPEIPLLSYQVIHPFTDLLLHDMGPGLADGREDFEASGREWRTPPLWGIGLTRVVNGHTRFLHDGRARSVEEAILWHAGEATAARDAFTHASASERAALLAFLDSL